MANLLQEPTSPNRPAPGLPAEIRWPGRAPDFAVPPDGVHVWAFSLEGPATRLETFRSILSPSEKARADRFHFRRDRERFVAGRAQLRILLARYLRMEPAAVDFVFGPHGKPELAKRPAETDLRFNLAHSEGLAIAAVSGVECGIDIERVRPLSDFDELVARFFSPRESSSFQAAAPEDKASAFFNLWTRKEAWLKAIGEGIGYALDKVEVSFLPGEPPRLLALPNAAGPAARWSLTALEPAAGFVAAVAARRPATVLSTFQLETGDV
jgi:4'-phosphopantetheinyl transferase